MRLANCGNTLRAHIHNLYLVITYNTIRVMNQYGIVKAICDWVIGAAELPYILRKKVQRLSHGRASLNKAQQE